MLGCLVGLSDSPGFKVVDRKLNKIYYSYSGVGDGVLFFSSVDHWDGA